MPPRVPLPTTTTIAAIASPPGGALRGILRLSGPASAALARAVLASSPRLPATRTALRDRFDDGAGTQPVLALWMPGPRSYTREDVLELHLPGAEPLLGRALGRLLELGATPAQPGEFTRRAFLNGRLDLTRAEAVLELVEATNDAERRAATRLLAGGLAERVAALRDALDDVRALAEASLASNGALHDAILGELAR
jgi:tRNA modification GTPase